MPMTSLGTWQEGGRFEHLPGSGFTYVTDVLLEGDTERALRGPKPMELLLGAAAGCTGVDVVSILAKMRLSIRSLLVHVEGERAETHPRVFRRVRLIYEIETDPPDLEKVKRAVELSATRYCGALATLASTADVTYVLRHAGTETEGVVTSAVKGA
jgi:putative redox protein